MFFISSFVGREKIFHSKGKLENDKIEDWSKFKKEKKELRLVRKKKKNEDLFEICVQVKKLGEKLRMYALYIKTDYMLLCLIIYFF